MACYHPITGWRGKTVGKSGKRPIVFNTNDGFYDMPVTLPCGRCIGCKLEKSKQWAVRCVHESQQYINNTFITLTYNKENVPQSGSLKLKHYQLFMKRLRQEIKRHPEKFKQEGEKIKFFHCGEYGEELGRPHYHAIIFNLDFADKKYHKGQDDNKLYTSEILETLWGKGYAVIGSVTFESAAYVARYVTKKITGKEAENHYGGKKPEYITMSRNPGIGAQWYKKWSEEVYPDDFIIMRGKKLKPPKYYDLKKEEEDKKGFNQVRQARAEKQEKHKVDQTHTRLMVREQVQIANMKQLTRTYETEL